MSDSLGIHLDGVTLDLPVFGGATRSMRAELVQRFLPNRKSRFVEDSVSVLRDITLSLGTGDRIGLQGHNGAGKSSLLRLLAGIYWPTHGIARVDGSVRCLFGLNPGIQEEGTGYENIKILSRLLGYPKSELAAIEADVAEFCDLGSALDRPVRTYSDGMRLRLCFGVITARPADILLIDEVIGVGDREFKEKAIERMKALIFRSGILVLASHDAEILTSFCTESIRMERGSIVERTSLTTDDQ
ncbi:MAG: ABC transporter ATP-binding protein [Verrucomicrobiales bacterium]|nr:ABC transporter ATP-binding protein [Verrucomicrobiales bacterium]